MDYMTARQNNLPTAKVGNVDLYLQEITEYLEAGKIFIVQYRKIYQIKHVNYKPEFIPYCGQLISTFQKPLTKRGHFYAMTAKEVNNLVGFELLAD